LLTAFFLSLFYSQAIMTAEMGRRPSLHGSENWRDLVKAARGETVAELMQRLYKDSGYEVARAERAIVFLDNVAGAAGKVADYGDDQRALCTEVLNEIRDVIDGTKVEVKGPKYLSDDFKRRARSDDNGKNANVDSGFETDVGELEDDHRQSEEDMDVVTLDTSHMFFICFGVNEDGENLWAEERSKGRKHHHGEQPQNLANAKGEKKVLEP